MIRELLTDTDVRRSFDVMHELRPHLTTPDEYVERVARQRAGGYRLIGVEEDGAVKAVAGFRIVEMLFQGTHLYVDDLVTAETERTKGHAAALMDWMIDLGTRESCTSLELDSGVQRFGAHAFYFTERMAIAAYHFTLKLPAPRL